MPNSNLRRMMMARKSSAPSGGIVTDGLVFRLNGLNQGGVPGHWIDEIGGLDFTPKNASYWEQMPNGWFANNSRAELDANIDFILDVTGTLEVAGSFTASGGDRIITSSNAAPQLAVICYGKSIIIGNREAYLLMYKFSGRKKPMTLSISDSFGFLNKTQLERDSRPDYYSAAFPTMALGGDFDPRAMTGNYHEVRFYNRQLSEAEILQNQQYDIDTYFGGVIPE